MKEKILILGNGLLGKEIKKQTGWDITSRKHGFDINYPLMYPKFLAKYTTLINCVACTDTYSTVKDEHWKTNYESVYHLTNYCNKHEIKLVHIGTDYMYANNRKESPTENDVPVHDENWYSYTKLLGDGIIQMLSNNYLLCRCGHKPHPFPFATAFIDKVGNFDYVSEITKLIVQLVKQNACGVYNVGTEKKNMFELAQRSNSAVKIGYTPENIPKDTTMSLDKLSQFLTK